MDAKRSKDYYSLFISKKAKQPNAILKLQNYFNLTEEQLQQIFSLPHQVALEPYVRTFQYKVLNRILFTNDKLYKIGFILYKGCTFCKNEPETFTHLLCSCSHSKAFWQDFEAYWLKVKNERIYLTFEDIIVGIIRRPCPLLNYFLLIGKITYGNVEETKFVQTIGGLRLKLNLSTKQKLILRRRVTKIIFTPEMDKLDFVSFHHY